MASSKKAIYAAIVGNFAIAVTKFIAAGISGSAAMLSEGIHSLVDTGNGGLLLFGLKRATRSADATHPYGYGKEVYFYTLMVAVLVFALGGGVSIYEGIHHILESLDPAHAVELGDPTLSYIVLAIAIVFESIVWWIAWKEFHQIKGSRTSWAYIKGSKDPTLFAVLLEDSAALAGLVVALIGISLSQALEMPVLDGAASVIIGLILCVVATLLLRESKGLLVGEAADPEVVAAIRQLTQDDPAVNEVVRALTLHMGPTSVLLTIDADFNDGLSAEEVEEAIDRMERRIREAHPEVKYIFIEAERLGSRRRDGQVHDTTGTEPPLPTQP